MRERVFKRDGGVCQICGGVVGIKEMTLDHVVPKSKGGKFVFDNLRTSHEDCNNKRGCDDVISTNERISLQARDDFDRYSG